MNKRRIYFFFVIFTYIPSLLAGTMGEEPLIWDRFYGGINLGAAFSSSNPIRTHANNLDYCSAANCSQSQAYANAAIAGIKSSFSLSNAGFIGGAQLGFNASLQPNWLFGIEADIDGLSENNQQHWHGSLINVTDNAGTAQIINTSIAVTQGVDYLGTLRGHLGYLARPSVLLSATGGFAYGGARSKAYFVQNYGMPENATNLLSNWGSSAHYATTRMGWTVGGRLAWMPYPLWSVHAEYLYYNLGSVTYSGGNLINRFTNGVSEFFSNSTSIRTRFDGNLVRLGVNYYFG